MHIKLEPIETLNDKEKEILKQFSLGMLREDVAKNFNIAPKTLRFYLHRIYMKLGVKKLHQAIVWHFVENYHLKAKD
jgi:DNA-binding CsgD family transcriptional regulator